MEGAKSYKLQNSGLTGRESISSRSCLPDPSNLLLSREFLFPSSAFGKLREERKHEKNEGDIFLKLAKTYLTGVAYLAKHFPDERVSLIAQVAWAKIGKYRPGLILEVYRHNEEGYVRDVFGSYSDIEIDEDTEVEGDTKEDEKASNVVERDSLSTSEESTSSKKHDKQRDKTITKIPAGNISGEDNFIYDLPFLSSDFPFHRNHRYEVQLSKQGNKRPNIVIPYELYESAIQGGNPVRVLGSIAASCAEIALANFDDEYTPASSILPWSSEELKYSIESEVLNRLFKINFRKGSMHEFFCNMHRVKEMKEEEWKYYDYMLSTFPDGLNSIDFDMEFFKILLFKLKTDDIVVQN